jgi:hypothetical protein
LSMNVSTARIEPLRLHSGCGDAAWLGAAAIVQIESGPRLAPDGRPELHALLLRRQACIIVEN